MSIDVADLVLDPDLEPIKLETIEIAFDPIQSMSQPNNLAQTYWFRLSQIELAWIGST